MSAWPSAKTRDTSGLRRHAAEQRARIERTAEDGSVERRCPQCEQWLPEDRFGWRMGGTRQSWCKDCARTYARNRVRGGAIDRVLSSRIGIPLNVPPITDHQLAVFAARFATGSVKAAAERLGVSQSTVKHATTEVLYRTGTMSTEHAAYVLWLHDLWADRGEDER